MDASIDLETEKLSENFGYLATIGSTTPFIVYLVLFGE